MSNYVELYPIDRVPQRIVDIIHTDLSNTDDRSTQHVLAEQLSYIGLAETYTDVYFVAAFSNDIYLGGVVLFVRTKDPITDRYYFNTGPPAPFFQGICKSRAGYDFTVKLNSLLIPFIINYLAGRGFHNVYVNPIHPQRIILQKHYEFTDAMSGGLLVHHIV